MLRRWALSILTLVGLWAALIALVAVWRPPTLVATEGWAADLLFKLTPPVPARTIIVGIGEDDLRQLGQWPWSRDVSAKLVDRMTEAGASAFGMMITFAEPDRLATPENDTDAALVKALSDRPTVVDTLYSPQGTPDLPMNGALGVVFLGKDRPIYTLPLRVPNLPAIERVTTVAPAFSYADADGITRKVGAFAAMPRGTLPGFATAMVARAEHCPMANLQMRNTYEGAMSLCAGAPVPLGQFAALTVARIEGPRQIYSPASLLTGALPSEIQGRPVLFGALAAGLATQIQSPAGPITTVEMNARAIDTLLARAALQRDQTISFLIMLAIAVLCLTGRSLLFLGIAGAGVIGAACYYATQGLLIEPVGMLLALIGAYLAPRWRS